MFFYKFNKYFSEIIIFIFFFTILNIFQISYIKYCNYITFNRLDTLFPRILKWEKDYKIYSISMPKFYSNIINKKCVLFISNGVNMTD